VLVSDFLAWFHHVVRHKVPLFWWFHTVHHAQRTLNAWTNERVHALDTLAATLIAFLPATVLGVSPPGMMGYVILSAWYTRLYHANLRTNYGILRFVLVTPQSHRVHHSIQPEHRDQNFGVIFSVWDHLFGTQCRDYDVYPETGISDAAFPQERRWADALSLRSFLAQQLYPLRLFAQHVTTSSRNAAVRARRRWGI
jgi:sterol desaturase/sphingolipid hydroxylase (fatty acid hydroxylase superfamily)